MNYDFKNRENPVRTRQVLRTVGPCTLAGMLAAATGASVQSASVDASMGLGLAMAGSVALSIYLLIAVMLLWLDPELRNVRDRARHYARIASLRL